MKSDWLIDWLNVSCCCQAEIESRVELEKRLQQAEEALQDLEKGLESLERTKETEEKMKGDVTQLRSECIPWYLSSNINVWPDELQQGSYLTESQSLSMRKEYHELPVQNIQ